MKHKKIILLFLILPLILLSACSGSAISTKSELTEQTKQYQTSIKNQDKLLTRLNKELNTTREAFDNLKKGDSLDDLKDDLNSRKDTLNELAAEIKTQEKLNNNFDKTANLENKNFPNSSLKQLTQSIKIIQMDNESFNQYLKKVTETEDNVVNSFDQDDYTKGNLNDDLVALKSYYGAANQQLEIWQVNVARVKENTKKLVDSLK